MPKYVFKQTSQDFYQKDISTLTSEFEAEGLESILENFEMFLRGCGYYFEGRLDIVNDDETNHFSDPSDEDYNDSFNILWPNLPPKGDVS